MAKITWLGEGDQGAKENKWRGQTFEKDKAVDTDDPDLIAMARDNRFFKVEGAPEKEGESSEVVHRPPSQQFTQFPVPKGGEPVVSGETGPGQPAPRGPTPTPVQVPPEKPTDEGESERSSIVKGPMVTPAKPPTKK